MVKLKLARIGWLSLILLPFMSANITAQTRQKEFFSAKPYLVAISVSDLDRTVKWYGDNLSFTLIRRTDLPRYSLRLAFMELNNFQLELIEFKQSASFAAIRKQFPGID